MITKQMLSNISYNTETKLKTKLQELYDNNHLDYYMYIFHKKEKGENKDHFHVFLKPSHRIDTKILENEFMETDINNVLPLGFTKMWKTEGKNKELDWILYVLHEPVYIKAKCEVDKIYIYTPDEIKSPDKDTLDSLVYRAYHETEFFHDKAILEIVKKNKYNGAELIENGYIPIKNACSYHHFLQMYNGG